MPPIKHRNDQLFTADVEFADQIRVIRGLSAGGSIDVSAVPEAVVASDLTRVIRHAQISITSLVISVTAALDYGGEKICDLPDSNILILGAEANLSLAKDLTGIIASTDVTMGIGTAVASNATLSAAMIDVLTEALTADVDPALMKAHTNAMASPALTFVDDGAASALYLNAAATLSADGTLTVTGTVDIYYIDTGNTTS